MDETKDGGANALPAPVTESTPTVQDQRPAWAKLWIEARERPWTTLTVVPGQEGYDVSSAARALADVGRATLAGEVLHEAAEGLTLEDSHKLLERLSAAKAAGTPTIVSLDSPLTNRAALLVARKTDASILVVPLETCPLAQARETVGEVGADRFVGTLVVRPR